MSHHDEARRVIAEVLVRHRTHVYLSMKTGEYSANDALVGDLLAAAGLLRERSAARCSCDYVRDPREPWYTRVPVAGCPKHSDQHSFTHVATPFAREWAQCSCGWVSADVIGAIAARSEWARHVKAAA